MVVYTDVENSNAISLLRTFYEVIDTSRIGPSSYQVKLGGRINHAYFQINV